MPDKDCNFENVLKRLDILVYLIAEQVHEQTGRPKAEMFIRLRDLGLKEIEIAKIFGTTRGSVSGQITKLKQVK